MGKEAVLDTSAIITIFTAKNLFKEISLSNILFLSPDCVKKELGDFASHNDFLGKRAKEALERIRFENVQKEEIEKKKRILGLSGRGGITDCDVASLELSLQKGITLYIDDFDAHLHFSRFFQDANIFYGILFVCERLQHTRDRREILDLLFDQLIPLRWESITQRNILNIRYAVTEFLEI